jgi:putative acetyltransferase
MKIYDIQDRAPQLISALTAVWEASVRATHLFLSSTEIEQIKSYVPQAIENVERLTVAENDSGEPIAFMGTDSGRLEMLFISPAERGKSLGKKLLHLGIEEYNVRELTVNEQNPQAVGFYEHMGFAVYKRTPLDEQGQPYPLLYMRLRTCLEFE